MSRKPHKLPSYRLHKASGQAVVTLSGEDFYLGLHGSPVSRAEYDPVLAEGFANERRVATSPPQATVQLTVSKMFLRNWIFDKAHYCNAGVPSRELDNIGDAILPLRDLYGHTFAA